MPLPQNSCFETRIRCGFAAGRRAEAGGAVVGVARGWIFTGSLRLRGGGDTEEEKDAEMLPVEEPFTLSGGGGIAMAAEQPDATEEGLDPGRSGASPSKRGESLPGEGMAGGWGREGPGGRAAGLSEAEMEVLDREARQRHEDAMAVLGDGKGPTSRQEALQAAVLARSMTEGTPSASLTSRPFVPVGRQDDGLDPPPPAEPDDSSKEEESAAPAPRSSVPVTPSRRAAPLADPATPSRRLAALREAVNSPRSGATAFMTPSRHTPTTPRGTRTPGSASIATPRTPFTPRTPGPGGGGGGGGEGEGGSRAPDVEDLLASHAASGLRSEGIFSFRNPTRFQT